LSINPSGTDNPPFKTFKNTVIWKVMGDRPSGLKCNLFKLLDRTSLTMKGVTLNFFSGVLSVSDLFYTKLTPQLHKNGARTALKDYRMASILDKVG
jgi:hypothetical protein